MLNNKLKAHHALAGPTQLDLASKVELRDEKVTKQETGQAVLDWKTKARASNILGVRTFEIWED